MELLEEGLIAFFSAVGLTACVWLTAGAFLGAGRRGNSEVLLVLPLRGQAPAMEADVRELLRARRGLPGATIVLVDCGLAPEGRDMAAYFCQRYRRVELRGGEELCVAAEERT